MLETDHFPKKGKDNIINVRLSEDYGEWSYITKNVKLNKLNEIEINKIFSSEYIGDWEIYVYALDRGAAINKAHKIFKKEMKDERFPLF